MAFPLVSVLSAAPGMLSAAADILRLVREHKATQPSSEERIAQLEQLVERQAELNEELARTNRNLALAVRNNRLLNLLSLVIALSALGLALGSGVALE